MNQQNGGNPLGEHLLEPFSQGHERDSKPQQERDQQQQSREIDQETSQYLHLILPQAPDKDQQPSQQTQTPTFNTRFNKCQGLQMTETPPESGHVSRIHTHR
ncbi:hypothetical protein E4U19_003906 [Claviceps sp. Clav32 group G5]|nr:hypothetical protein E4U19_003906 [Claviceps sp. Clav32 group G5]KAG6046071.1 hypothetical protein E4U39_001672 [Claviceps sp. Clav50 group G5]